MAKGKPKPVRIELDEAGVAELRVFFLEQFDAEMPEGDGIDAEYFRDHLAEMNWHFDYIEISAEAAAMLAAKSPVEAEPAAAMPTPIDGKSPEEVREIMTLALTANGHTPEEIERLLSMMAPPAPTRPRGMRDIPDDPKSDRSYMELLIPITTGPDGRWPVPVSLNGRAMFIERGKPQEVRVPYARVLRDAMNVEYEERKSVNGPGFDLIPKAVWSYPFQILDGPYYPKRGADVKLPPSPLELGDPMSDANSAAT